MSSGELWAVWRHPIIRQETEPVPVVATGERADMEDKFFRLCEDPNEDEFYLEVGPFAEGAKKHGP